MRGPAAPQALSPVTIVTTGLVVGAWYLSQQQAVEQVSYGRACAQECYQPAELLMVVLVAQQ